MRPDCGSFTSDMAANVIAFRLLLAVAGLASLACAGSLPPPSQLTTARLRSDNSDNVVVVSTTTPRLQWQYGSVPQGAPRGLAASAFQLVLSNVLSGHTLYDSGKTVRKLHWLLFYRLFLSPLCFIHLFSSPLPFAPFAYASYLSSVQLFSRCFSHRTGSTLSSICSISFSSLVFQKREGLLFSWFLAFFRLFLFLVSSISFLFDPLPIFSSLL